MRNVSLLGRRVAGLLPSVAVAGAAAAFAVVTPALAADLDSGAYAPPPPAYGAPPPAYAAPAYVEPVPVPVAPVPVYRPYYAWGAPYYRPYWRGYWGPRYAGWYGRPWGWRHY